MSALQSPEQNVSLPTKTVDAEKSVDDRLTNNTRDNILPARYLLKDENGVPKEDANGMFDRVAENVAKVEGEDEDYWRDEFAHQMKTLKFMPNSPTLMNAGLELQQLSACFVLEPQDDMDDILQTAKDAGGIFKSGGGVGYTFSNLRPKGTLITSTQGTTSGPVSFMRLYDEVCNQVKQGGKRRGAQMGIMRVDHPDIGRFITAKRDEGELSNFNVSVGVTDDFIEAVENDGLYALNDPEQDFDAQYEGAQSGATRRYYHPDEGALGIWDYADDVYCDNSEQTLREKWADTVDWDELLSGKQQLPARFIWDIMVDGAWRNGEPGLFHLDETNRQHSFDVDEHEEHEIKATNPCAEQPLSNYEACNLGHVNLSLFKKEEAPTFSEFDGSIGEYFETAIDLKELNRTISNGTRFLDNVVDMSDFPLEEIEETVNDLRKIGLGVMGWAQLLYQMDIRYGSEESIELGNLMMNHIDHVATETSHLLAKERGSFPAWEDSKYANPTDYPEWFEEHVHEDPERFADGFAMRNHNVTTVAPTGTTSMIGDTSGGIEPVYAVIYEKHVAEDIGTQVEIDSYFRDALEANGIDVQKVKDEAARKMGDDNATYDGPHDLPIPDELADKFVTTGDVSPREHTLMQRSFQNGVDSGISKTVNLPSDATRSDITDAYTTALAQEGIGSAIKGMTVYRNQSRKDQVKTTQSHSDKEIDGAIKILEDAGYDVTEEDTVGDKSFD